MKNTGGRILFWGVGLVLLLACTPSMVTPVPPLDSAAINTYIAQTAAAAFLQTQAAVQPSPTITPTLRSTFTPDPTFTAVPVINFPSPTPLRQLYYYRIKHDSQLAMFNYKSRTAAPDWIGVDNFTPEVVPLFVQPALGSGTHRTRLTGDWEAYINMLNNNSERKLLYLKANNTALFNNSGFPNMESLTMGGNIVTLAEVKNGWGRVNTINYSNPGPLKDLNYATRPDLVHKFVVVAWNKETKRTYWVDPPVGALYYPLVSSRDVWIQMERLEPFPTLPVVVTAKQSQSIRKTPAENGEETRFKFSEGDTAQIVEYYPSGSNVWGRLSNGGWIALALGARFMTDWSMATVPPPP
ncbi:MAG: hypothetical protein HXY42_05535 [Chloroflexi bacterium]|nr:hypothetical protein [Chloroflexota bacterium]